MTDEPGVTEYDCPNPDCDGTATYYGTHADRGNVYECDDCENHYSEAMVLLGQV